MSLQEFHPSEDFWARAGAPQLPVLADLSWIRTKHPSEFKTDESVAAHIQFVLDGTDFITFKGTAKGAWGFLRQGDARCAVIQLLARRSADGRRVYHVLTAYTMRPAQIARALGEGAAPVANLGSSVTRAAHGGAGSRGRPSESASQSSDQDTPGPIRINPPAFGTRERERLYGIQEGGYASGARADRKKATRARGRHALTKKGREEQAELQAQDPETRSHLAAQAKVHRAFESALKRVLGPEGRAHAVKIAPASGSFRAADVAAFLRDGWTVLPAASLPAKVGTVLGAVEPLSLNPSGPDLARVLGPKGEARALVLAHAEPVFDRALLERFREAGFDVSPAPKTIREGLKINPTKFPGHSEAGADTRERESGQASSMAKKTVKTPRKATAKAKPPKAAKTRATAAEVQPLRSKAADAHRLVKAIEKAVKPKGKTKPKAAHLAVEKVTVTARAVVNPTTVSHLDRAWNRWTGAKPGQVLMVKVPAATVATPAGTVRLPAQVVFLGRLSSIITNSRGEKAEMAFGDTGPYLVSDAELQHLWILSPKKLPDFHIRNVALIAYLARKPKFGDRGVIKYIHAFEGPTQAALRGQVGLFKGHFRLTPRGIEG